MIKKMLIFSIILTLLSTVFAVFAPESVRGVYGTPGMMIGFFLFIAGISLWVLRTIKRFFDKVLIKNSANNKIVDKVSEQPTNLKSKILFLIRKLQLIMVNIIFYGFMALLLFIFVYLFIAQPTQIDGDLMNPALQNGDYILVSKIKYRIESPMRGDIIVFHSPQDERIDSIKRIIGLPDDKILINNGYVYINNEKLEEPYTLSTTNERRFLKENNAIKVPKEQYFVMDDNRISTNDSRQWGFVTLTEIVGKAWIRYWPNSKYIY